MRGNQHDSPPCTTQYFRMFWIFCTEAKVYEVHSMPRGPIDCVHQRMYVRRQRLVKYFHCEYFSIGSLLTNHCRYGRSVA